MKKPCAESFAKSSRAWSDFHQTPDALRLPENKAAARFELPQSPSLAPKVIESWRFHEFIIQLIFGLDGGYRSDLGSSQGFH